VFYAGCGLRDKYKAHGYRPYASVFAFHGTADEETGYATCRRLVERSRAMGGDIELVTYRGATHSFDDPGRNRQSLPANQFARGDSIMRSEAFFERILAQGLPPR
jgi:carboxymethylenebutenolidase